MFKVNNKDTSGVVLVSLLLTYLTPCSSASVANFADLFLSISFLWIIFYVSPQENQELQYFKEIRNKITKINVLVFFFEMLFYAVTRQHVSWNQNQNREKKSNFYAILLFLLLNQEQSIQIDVTKILLNSFPQNSCSPEYCK